MPVMKDRIAEKWLYGPSSTWLKAKHSAIRTFPVIGYVPDGPRIEALLVAERSPSMRLIGRVEFPPPRRPRRRRPRRAALSDPAQALHPDRAARAGRPLGRAAVDGTASGRQANPGSGACLIQVPTIGVRALTNLNLR
jgi:hypothetical protein